MPTFYFGAAAAVSPGSKIRIMKLDTSSPGPNGPGTLFFSGGRLLGVFIVAGILAALAGLLQAGRIASIPSSLDQNLIFNAFAAAVLGGVSLNGGRGTIAGACGGVLLLVLIQDVLVPSRVPAYWINATTGGIILVAIYISKLCGADRARRQNGGRKGCHFSKQKPIRSIARKPDAIAGFPRRRRGRI